MNRQRDLLRKVQTFQYAANNHEIGKILKMFADDAKFYMVGQNPLKGKEQIRRFFEYDAGVNGELEFIDCTCEGNTVSCQMLERNERLKTAGISELLYTSCLISFRKELIHKFRAIRDAETTRTLDKVWPDFRAWVAQNYQSDYSKMFTREGRFIRNRENGARSVTLLKEWRASHRIDPNDISG
jgi:ketosteroid isomerase-like protein